MRNYNYISIKSKIGVEYRRYAIESSGVQDFESFYKRIEAAHHLRDIPFVIFYMDSDNFPLPINNDDNLAKAIKSAKHIYLSDVYHRLNQFQHQFDNNNYYPPPLIRRPYLKLFIEKKGDFLNYHNGDLAAIFKKGQNFKGLSNFMNSSGHDQNLRPSIGAPADFRQVSSIIDVDQVPKFCRRVRIVKHGSDRPLGFYICNGTYKRQNDMTGQIEIVTSVFISRLVPGGLAESTGLLAVGDEVLEVNGIQVMYGKTLDQVTDMMVANASNLIMTIRPGHLNSTYKQPQALDNSNIMLND